LLADRGHALDDAHRAKVAACPDPLQLDRWIAAALTAPSLAAVFD
jgi:hypothetical protein